MSVRPAFGGGAQACHKIINTLKAGAASGALSSRLTRSNGYEMKCAPHAKSAHIFARDLIYFHVAAQCPRAHTAKTVGIWHSHQLQSLIAAGFRVKIIFRSRFDNVLLLLLFLLHSYALLSSD